VRHPAVSLQLSRESQQSSIAAVRAGEFQAIWGALASRLITRNGRLASVASHRWRVDSQKPSSFTTHVASEKVLDRNRLRQFLVERGGGPMDFDFLGRRRTARSGVGFGHPRVAAGLTQRIIGGRVTCRIG
jgi:hypothetical protein